MSEKTNWASAFGRSFDSIPAPANRARADLSAVPPLTDEAGGTPSEVETQIESGPTASPDETAVEETEHGTAPPRNNAAVTQPSTQEQSVGSTPELPPTRRGAEAAVEKAAQARAGADTPRERVTSSRGRLGQGVPTGSGLRLSATQLRARRVAARYATVVSERLEPLGVGGVDLAAELVGDTVRVLVPVGDVAVDRVLDAIADQFTDTEVVEVELTEQDDVIVVLAVVDEEPAKQRAAWVPAGLRERVREHLELTGESVSQLVLRAFNTYHDRLPSMFDGTESPAGPLRGVATKRRHGVETPVQLTMYWHRSHEQEIQSAVRASGARSRSDLITVLLETYLDDLSHEGTASSRIAKSEVNVGLVQPAAASERVSMLEELEREWESSHS